MYLPNLLTKVQYEFAPDKRFNFRVRFPSESEIGRVSEFSGGGAFGPGYDPCPYTTWFPAKSVMVPVGWFVQETQLDYYMIQVPVPTKMVFQKIDLTVEMDRYKKLENWFERWYETIANGGKHIGTLREIARPFQVIKTFSNPFQALNHDSDGSDGFNLTTWYVVPTGQITDQLEYTNGSKSVQIQFNIVGKLADKRAMKSPKKIY